MTVTEIAFSAFILAILTLFLVIFAIQVGHVAAAAWDWVLRRFGR